MLIFPPDGRCSAGMWSEWIIRGDTIRRTIIGIVPLLRTAGESKWGMLRCKHQICFTDSTSTTLTHYTLSWDSVTGDYKVKTLERTRCWTWIVLNLNYLRTPRNCCLWDYRNNLSSPVVLVVWFGHFLHESCLHFCNPQLSAVGLGLGYL